MLGSDLYTKLDFVSHISLFGLGPWSLGLGRRRLRDLGRGAAEVSGPPFAGTGASCGRFTPAEFWRSFRSSIDSLVFSSIVGGRGGPCIARPVRTSVVDED